MPRTRDRQIGDRCVTHLASPLGGIWRADAERHSSSTPFPVNTPFVETTASTHAVQCLVAIARRLPPRDAARCAPRRRRHAGGDDRFSPQPLRRRNSAFI